MEESLASGHTKLGSINVAIDGRAKIINQSLSSVKKSLASGRREQGALLRQQKALSSKLTTRLDDICSTLTQQIATISLRETEKNEIFFEGGANLGTIALPLMLMQTDLVKALRTLVTEGAIRISRSEARWIEEEFENLLVHGHEAAALDSRSRYSKARKSHAHHLGSALTTRTACSKTVSLRGNSQNQNQHHISTTKLQSTHRVQRRHQIYTAAGILVLETGAHGEEVHTFDRSSSSLLTFRISFLPKLSLSSVSFTAAFSKVLGMDMEQKITRLIHTYNTIPYKSEAMICAEGNDVVGLQKLFAAGKASPYDCDESGDSLLDVSSNFHLYVVSSLFGFFFGFFSASGLADMS